ncbi:hypothetical protein F5Y16DRAFT_392012 [Xylariaceae sp. FL0255]|nr:hypothetical protein F5Y16DRAFT_392012 [Xylariaceae sp. FL0255]
MSNSTLTDTYILECMQLMHAGLTTGIRRRSELSSSTLRTGPSTRIPTTDAKDSVISNVERVGGTNHPVAFATIEPGCISQTISAISWLAKPEVVNDELNPAYLALARSGYHLQRRLRIPDWLGLFSPGPARLQTSEGALFVCFFLFQLTLWLGLLPLVLFFQPKPRDLQLLFFVYLAVVVGPTIASMWALFRIDKHRHLQDDDYGSNDTQEEQ